MPKQPFISIPLDIPDLRVLQSDLTQANEYILTVESTLESTSCRRCGRTITERYGTDQPRLLRHLLILGSPLYLRIRPKRFRCPFCDDHPTTTQQLDWYDPTALHTKAYERHLIVELINGLFPFWKQEQSIMALQDLPWETCVLWTSFTASQSHARKAVHG